MPHAMMMGCDCTNRAVDVPLNEMDGIMHWVQVISQGDREDTLLCFVFECDRCGVRVRASIQIDPTEGDL